MNNVIKSNYIVQAAKYYVDRFSCQKVDDYYDLMWQSMLYGDARDVAIGEEASNVNLEEICAAAYEKFFMEDSINTNGGYISAILELERNPYDDKEVLSFSKDFSKFGRGKCIADEVENVYDAILRWEFEEKLVVEDIRAILECFTRCKIMGYPSVYLEITIPTGEKYIIENENSYRWH